MTKITTGRVRLSYPWLAEPRPSSDGGQPKYSATLLIDKNEIALGKDGKTTMQRIKEALKDAEAEYREKNGVNSLPPKPSHTIHDGDELKDTGEEYGPECKGCYVITVTTKTPPLFLDKYRCEVDPADIEKEFYAGCYVRASINFKGYSFNGKKGITAYLNGIMKVADGDRLGSQGASASDFDDGFPVDDDDDDFFA